MPSTRTENTRRELAKLTSERAHLAERLLCQVEFAEGLARLHPAESRRWAAITGRAMDLLEQALRAGRLDRLKRTVAEAETLMAPIAKVAKTYTIHCVGHAHIDMNWMWSWPETAAITNDTFRTVLALMDEFPDFCFTQSQASVYALVKEYNPALLAEIAKRVAEGRWEIAAVHWVEGDKNIAAGEAIARHLLYTRRFMRETFGLAPEDVPIDWEPDTFGHAATIPTILSRGGVRRYYMCRGGAFEKPPVFWWQGPDGSRILVNLETTWYNDYIGPHNTVAMLAFCEKTGLRDWMNVYGVGDHGGGPTRRDIVRAHEMNSWPVYPTFRLSTTRDFYAVLERNASRWPVIERELNFEFTGCYTSQAMIKQANRWGENACLEAEAAAAVARRAAGWPYPADLIREAWINTLFGHFHDILPGSGVRATRDYQLGLFQKTAAAMGITRTESLRAIAAIADTTLNGTVSARPNPDLESMSLGAGAGRGTVLGAITAAGHVADGPRAFLVFNPLAWQRNEVVTATLWDAEESLPARTPKPKSWIVRTADGRPAQAQRIGAGEYWGHTFIDVALPAEVAGLGYSAMVVEEGEAPPPASGVRCGAGFRGGERQPEGSLTMENEHILAAFDRSTGGVVNLVDKATGIDLASPADPAALLEYVLERPRGMTAWIIAEAKERKCPLPLESFAADHRGPYVATMVAKLKVNESDVTVTYALKAGQPWLDITVQARWVERGGPEKGVPGLRVKFPLALKGTKARYEVPFGWVERDLARGEEVPALRWADVTGRTADGRQAGCTLLNDCKYGHSLDGSTLRLTLIRSTYDPDPLPETGDHTIRMALVPHGGQAAAADLVRLGAAFNHPLSVVATDVHAGRLPPQASAVTVSAPNVVISSVRKAADDDGLVFHLFEIAGKKTTARVALDDRIFGQPSRAVEVDFLERPVESGTARLSDDGFSVTLAGRGIAAVKVLFKS